MSDLMRQIPFKKLVDWVMSEYEKEHSIFGIPKAKFYKRGSEKRRELCGEPLETPLGPAAGPHTQLAQNIVSAYLCGSSFFELKTVQLLDELEIAKPCIAAEDECYNTEWSTELTVAGAFAEYVKAWFVLHLLQKEIFNCTEPSFIFNMSVGYDLKGIKSDKVDSFIEGLKDAAQTEIFQECRGVLKEEIHRFQYVDEKYLDNISPHICNSITLSTLHGCPPGEIESISKYLLAEKGLHTFVKMNPTLLGYQYVQETFAKMGYGYIQLQQESFSHDLQYADGIALLKRLQGFAQENKKEFGVKLSNTLPVKITKGELPGTEMYLSGKALYPLTVNLALKLAQEFAGELKISYSGGADFFNITPILQTAIQPITLATTLLKPGGYLRLKQLAEEMEPHFNSKARKIDLKKLAELARSACEDSNYFTEKRAGSSRKMAMELPLLDCFIAPCIKGCPLEQDIPEYLRLIGEEKYQEAYAVIVSKNPLPLITGTICNHNCMNKCTRLDYEDSVYIREQKKIAAVKGHRGFIDKISKPELRSSLKVAVIGAGPAGLSAGYFLARAGIDVTIFDKRKKAGGTVEYVIPDFRISREVIQKDMELIEKMGVKFELGTGDSLSVNKLWEDGFSYICLAIGAGKANPLKLEHAGHNVRNALQFLEEFNNNNAHLNLGKNVVVIGGGNTALDAARAALRVKGVEKVSIAYRRTTEYMPADQEELELALSDGVIVKELLAPRSLKNGLLTFHKMKLGEPDASGRSKPVVLEGEYEKLPADTVISAIGELVDHAFLRKNGLEVDEQGNTIVNPETNETSVENVFIAGDALTGPATIVEALAGGSKVAQAIIAKENLRPEKDAVTRTAIDNEKRISEITRKKGRLTAASECIQESARCLECNFVCNICTEVCPNRANVAIKTGDNSGGNFNQVIHVDGMCNECGNCASFCPYRGAPYKNKLTLYWNEEDFLDSENSGFLLITDDEEPAFKLRWAEQIVDIKYNKKGEADVPIDSAIVALIWSTFRNYKYLF